MKELFFFALSLCFLSHGYGQASFGLKAGGNLSVMKFKEEPDYGDEYLSTNELTSTIDGLQAGVQFAYRVNFFELSGDLLFAQKGYRVVEEDFPVGQIQETKLRLGYLSLPASMRFYIVEGLYVGAGAEVAYLVSGTSTYAGRETNVLDLPDYVPYPNRWDVGVLAEVGYKLEWGLGFQLRFVQGLSDYYDGGIMYIDQNGEPIEDIDAKFRNRTLQLSVSMDLLKS